MKWLFLFPLFVACTPHMIAVQHEYLDRRYLASSYADTVDPRQCNFCGEMLIVRWHLSKACRSLKPTLLLTLRFHNQEVCEEVIPIKRGIGSYCYRLMNDRWRARGGILTYKVELQDKGRVLDTFEHQMWVEKIEVPLEK